MKKLLFAIVLILFGVNFQAEAQTKKLATTPSELLKKSDDQYKAGLILVSAGTALTLTSIALPNTYDYNDGSSNQSLISVLAWTGTLSIITSVPLFLAAGNNARLAARLSLENQAIHQPIYLPGHVRNIPSLSLRIAL